MSRMIIAYIATMIIFALIDFIWLGTVAKSFYRNQIGDLLLKDFRMDAAVVFYVIYIAGIVFFAVRPALEAESLRTAFLLGAAVGFLCYATYDLTNLATLKGFTATVAIVDIAWGTALTAMTAFFAAWFTRFVTA